MSKKQPPDRLSDRAKIKWHELIKQLSNYNHDQDGDTLALLCDSWDQYLAAQEHVKQHGQVMLSERNGRLFINPSKKIVDEERKSIVRLSKLLGVSPDLDGKSRPPENGNKWDGLIGDDK